MKIIECDQGSEQWHQARAGVITASMFRIARERVGGLTEQQKKYVNAMTMGVGEESAMACAGYKTKPTSEMVKKALAGLPIGDYSDAAKAYAFRLAIERISGQPLDESFETWSMRRGHELEPAARMEHEIQTGLIVQRAGFVTTDDNLFGGSADGLIGEDGGSEYKCLVSPEKLRSVLIDGDFSDYVDQVQGCMWLTGRKWWHFCLYCPALESIGRQLWYCHVDRDDNYIETMEQDLMSFAQLVADNEALLRAGSAPSEDDAEQAEAHEETARQAAAAQAVIDEAARVLCETAKADIRRISALVDGAEAYQSDIRAQTAPDPITEIFESIGVKVVDCEVVKEPTTPPTLKLGTICARLAPLSISADGLKQLGFEPAGRERSAVLFHESDWPAICGALIAHIERVAVAA